MMGPDVFLSSRMAKYISRLSFIFLAMYSVFTGLPVSMQAQPQAATAAACTASDMSSCYNHTCTV